VVPELVRHHRDALLAAAEDAVDAARRAGDDPVGIVPALHRAWRALAGPVTRFDPDFVPDDRTGVEGLAFVVGVEGRGLAGLLLRLPGELPDSFEPIDDPVDDGAPAAVRQAWFGSPPAR
jgi:hypothetical protein